MITRFFSARQIEFEIFPMSGQDESEAAAIHFARFRRSWDEDEIHSLLVQKPVFGFVARRSDGMRPLVGFVLARAMAGESEILTIAVHERYPRLGLGWRLMRAAMGEARNRGSETMFLEVDASNASAIALYRTLAFRQVGERAAYYDHGSGRRSAALVMRCDRL
ncbi:GNAT family N-acetyltransferase [Pararhizobium mangrovi]|uniref:GNAT family N-acetyltransferase n=1 Tax=Pararhizobium mangrovi TaxID=2590452 RepID=A0A506U1T3_9HYPH|nr:GNAT family N-acetyltransferase [Pararhizobium mangrovi]TPW28333.1 GNAT family N-acetyltransferase [Pararhizobium mangrovi]